MMRSIGEGDFMRRKVHDRNIGEQLCHMNPVLIWFRSSVEGLFDLIGGFNDTICLRPCELNDKQVDNAYLLP